MTGKAKVKASLRFSSGDVKGEGYHHFHSNDHKRKPETGPNAAVNNNLLRNMEEVWWRSSCAREICEEEYVDEHPELWVQTTDILLPTLDVVDLIPDGPFL